MPKPASVGLEALLGVDDLDRDDDREADQRQRLADQQRAHGPEVARELEPVEEALAPRRAVLVLRGREDRGRRPGRPRSARTRRRRPAARPRRRTPRSARPPAPRRTPTRPRSRGSSARCPRSAGPWAAAARHGAARQAAAGDRERAVDRAEREHQRQEEPIPIGQERQEREDERLDGVERRERLAQPKRSMRGQAGGEQRRRNSEQEEPAAGTSRTGRTPRWARPTPSGRTPGSRARRRRSSRRGH